jgi:hypothetical protein
LGIPDSNLVCKFIDDPAAITTATSYFPSDDLQRAVSEAELRTGLTFCGIIHSHPGSLSSPSWQDHVAFKKGLDRNPHISKFLAPIVTLLDDNAAAENEIALPGFGKLSNYVAYRSRQKGSLSFLSPPVDLANEPVGIIPVNQDISLLSSGLFEHLGEMPQRSDGLVDLSGIHHLTVTLRYQGAELIILIPPIYPFAPPSVLVTNIRARKPEPVPVRIGWSGAVGPQTWIDEVKDHIVAMQWELKDGEYCRP